MHFLQSYLHISFIFSTFAAAQQATSTILSLHISFIFSTFAAGNEIKKTLLVWIHYFSFQQDV